MNYISWALLALIILAIFLALKTYWKSRGSCGCSGCDQCSKSCCCDRKQDKNQ